MRDSTYTFRASLSLHDKNTRDSYTQVNDRRSFCGTIFGTGGIEDLDQAIEEYERLTDPNPENRDGRLINPINYYYLAELYEMKGKSAKAKKSYEKFLTLGKNADLWTAELEDARKRLAGLKRQ